MTALPEKTVEAHAATLYGIQRFGDSYADPQTPGRDVAALFFANEDAEARASWLFKARAALTAAMSDSLGPDRLVVAGETDDFTVTADELEFCLDRAEKAEAGVERLREAMIDALGALRGGITYMHNARVGKILRTALAASPSSDTESET